MGPRRVDTLRDALDSLVDPRRWPDGIKDYLTGYALEVLKRWGDGTRLIPDPWALMELAFNPLFKDLSKLPFIDRQLADEAEDLLLKEFDDAADFLNEKENAIDGPSPVPRHARRRSSNFGVQPPNQQQQVLGELAGMCELVNTCAEKFGKSQRVCLSCQCVPVPCPNDIASILPS